MFFRRASIRPVAGSSQRRAAAVVGGARTGSAQQSRARSAHGVSPAIPRAERARRQPSNPARGARTGRNPARGARRRQPSNPARGARTASAQQCSRVVADHASDILGGRSRRRRSGRPRGRSRPGGPGSAPGRGPSRGSRAPRRRRAPGARHLEDAIAVRAEHRAAELLDVDAASRRAPAVPRRGTRTRHASRCCGCRVQRAAAISAIVSSTERWPLASTASCSRIRSRISWQTGSRRPVVVEHAERHAAP